MKKRVESRQVLLRVPAPLLKRVDAAAKDQGRSRTAEVCMRLTESLRVERQAKAGVAP